MYDSKIGRFLTVDPKRIGASPFIGMANDPIGFIDPDGGGPTDWIKNLSTGKYEWRDDVTSPENTPDGYAYIGPSVNDVLFSLGIYQTHYDDQSLVMGALLLEYAKGRGSTFPKVAAKATTDVFINGIVDTNPSEGTENNVLGRKFKGVEFKIITSATVSGPGIRVTSSPTISIGRGNNWTTSLSGKTPSGQYLKSPGSRITEASVFYKASIIPKDYHFRGVQIRVSGSWQTNRGPVIKHILYPAPKTYEHNFTISH